MNGLDLVLVVLAAAAAVGGYRLGFVTRATSWLGMLIGIVAGSLALPSIIDRLDQRIDRADLVFVAAGVVIGGGLLGQALGLFVGSRLHLAIPAGRARRVDAVVGAVAGIVGVAVTVWLVVPAMADVPDWPARQARGSVVVRAVDRIFPEAPDPSKSVRRLLGDRYPRVFDAMRPAPELGPPPASGGLSDALTAKVTASTVLVAGQACDQIQEGSGFVVGDDLVATNAHVVAGESETEVVTTDGRRRTGSVVAFDPDRDLAIIHVEGLDRPALPLGAAAEGDRGAVFGHPGGGPLRLAPFEVGQRIDATGSDIYDNPGVTRQVLVLAAALRPGDSGSALVSPDGDVVGVAFAIAPDRPGVAYALSTRELQAVLRTVGTETVSAGGCIG
ncbi:MarP family serine protease [Aquihabitans sp. G128]|uniref:MarP family serine protease n=1 Tax=Aquihabitans sp. G128 TaxID=2849779 RepID=UPI001C210CAB|nr:MarP family serine protease [Aquihabitans sp. G128]QXC62044.1 MarP family serine protease [Aquihabitans sp. G128]